MTILSFLLSILILLMYLCLFFNQKYVLNIHAYIISLIIGFSVIILHLITDTTPYDLASVSLIGSLLLIYKHRVILQWKSARMFLLRIIVLLLGLITLASLLYLLSLIPVPILNGLFLWVCWITVSALFAFVHYLSWSSAFSMVENPNTSPLIVVLGAGLYKSQVTQMLAWRLDRAIELYQSQSNPNIIIVSGGYGKGEPVSEAEAMKDYLIQNHIPNSHIIMEDASHSTLENLINTKQLLQEHNIAPNNIAIVSSQFHVLRALRFAQKLKFKAHGIGSRTPYAFFDTALIRDFLAIMYTYKGLLTVYFGSLFIFSILEVNPFLRELLKSLF